METKKKYLRVSNFKSVDCDEKLIYNVFKPEEEPTPAMEFGTMLHKFILESSDFENEYYIVPESVFLKFDKINKDGSPSMTSKTNKDIVENLLAHGKKLVYPAVYEKMLAIKSQIQKYYPVFFDILRHEKTQTEKRFTCCIIVNTENRKIYYENESMLERETFYEVIDDFVKIYLSGTFDLVNFAINNIIDLKTTTDASNSAIERKIAELEYNVQEYLYRRLYCANKDIDFYDLDKTKFYFLFVETVEPYLVNFIKLDTLMMYITETKVSNKILFLADYLKSNSFIGYKDKDDKYGINTIKLPSYYISQK